MIELTLFWTFLTAIGIALVFLAREHFKICRLEKKVSRSWQELAKSMQEVDARLVKLQDDITQAEQRVKSAYDPLTVSHCQVEEVSLSIPQHLETHVKKLRSEIKKPKKKTVK